ncbi:hypothetical protein RA27_05335 [Ruegeria sp. ANG-R]|nr:hypothetical protein RA27_05335 [Ruegeria sp. ANG-R]
MPQQNRRGNGQDDLKEIGKAIRAIRRSRGWSQAEFAEMIGLARESLGQCELGRRNFRIKTYLAIRSVTGEDPVTLALEGSLQTVRKRDATPKVLLRLQRLVRRIRLMEARRKLVEARQRFEREVYSTIARRWNEARSGFFFGAVLTYVLRVLAIEYDIPFGEPSGPIDWVLVISFCTAALLLPLQFVDAVRFVMWHRKERGGRL